MLSARRLPGGLPNLVRGHRSQGQTQETGCLHFLFSVRSGQKEVQRTRGTTIASLSTRIIYTIVYLLIKQRGREGLWVKILTI